MNIYNVNEVIKMRKNLNLTDGIFPVPVLMVATQKVEYTLPFLDLRD